MDRDQLREVTSDPELDRQIKRVRVATAGVLGVILTGIVGYFLLGAESLLDATYMTVITVFTVGYTEVVPRTSAVEMFSIVLIIAGFGAGSYAAVTGVGFVVEGHLARQLGRRRMIKRIGELRDHVVVCGLGRVGEEVVDELEHEGVPFVIVDLSAERLARTKHASQLWIEGDATSESVLRAAGVERATAAVTAVNSDADNVLTTLTVKGLNPDCTVVARVKLVENESKLLRAGADRVISPTLIGGRRIGQLLTRPVLAAFLDGLAGKSLDTRMDELEIPKGSQLVGQTLKSANLRDQWGVTVVALRPSGAEELVLLPDPDRTLVAEDVLVIMGGDQDCERIREAAL